MDKSSLDKLIIKLTAATSLVPHMSVEWRELVYILKVIHVEIEILHNRINELERKDEP